MKNNIVKILGTFSATTYTCKWCNNQYQSGGQSAYPYCSKKCKADAGK